MMIYVRSLLFITGQVISVLLFSVMITLLLPFPPKQRSSIISNWVTFIVWWLKITCNLKHDVVGLDNIPDQPCVFASNHQSTWEAFALQTFLPPLAWVLKRELLLIPFFGWGLWATRPIAINRQDRRNAMEQVIYQGVKKLQEGRYVMIFPEGTRMPYGNSGKYKLGAIKLARQANVPIVPISHNSGKFWPKNSWLKQPGTITCHIGKPISVNNKTDQQVASDIKQWVEAQQN